MSVFDDLEAESLTTLGAWLVSLLLAVSLIVAVVLEGREASERCRAGVDVEASCQGVVRWNR